MTIECSFFGANKSGQVVGFSQEYMNGFAGNIVKALSVYYGGGGVEIEGGNTGEVVTRGRMEEYAKKELSLLQSYMKNHAMDSGSDSDPFEF